MTKAAKKTKAAKAAKETITEQFSTLAFCVFFVGRK
jgi:hypothetical protein